MFCLEKEEFDKALAIIATMEQYLGNAFPVEIYELAIEECVKQQLFSQAREYLLKCRIRGIVNYEQLISICLDEGNIDEAYLQSLNAFRIGRSPGTVRVRGPGI